MDILKAHRPSTQHGDDEQETWNLEKDAFCHTGATESEKIDFSSSCKEFLFRRHSKDD